MINTFPGRNASPNWNCRAQDNAIMSRYFNDLMRFSRTADFIFGSLRCLHKMQPLKIGRLNFSALAQTYKSPFAIRTDWSLPVARPKFYHPSAPSGQWNFAGVAYIRFRFIKSLLQFGSLFLFCLAQMTTNYGRKEHGGVNKAAGRGT